MGHYTIWGGSKSLEDARELDLVAEDVSERPPEGVPIPQPLPALLSHQSYPLLLPDPPTQLFPRLLYRAD